MRFCELLAIGLVGTLALSGAGLQIAGSDLLDDSIRMAITDALAAAGIDAEMSLDGSLLGINALSNGEIDACILAVPDGNDPVQKGQVYSFGFQIVAFAVNDRNPLSELDYVQLGGLFRANGTMDNWSDLVSSGDGQDRKVNLWAARSDKLIALEIFNSVALQGSPLKQSIRYSQLDPQNLMRIVENDISAIMVVPNIKPTPGVRLLAVKEEATAQSYTPSTDNVFYGDYPLRLPFKLIVADSVDPAVLASLLRALYSDSVTRALEAAFYMPLPATERQAILSQLK